jgi:nucleotide-binding universal stress UspA family protein
MTTTPIDEPEHDPTRGSGSRTLLVPLDGSAVAETALPIARVLGNRSGADVRVFDVPPAPDDPDQEPIGEFLSAVGTDPGTVLCLGARGHLAHSPCGSRDLADRILERLDAPAFVVGPHCSSGSFAFRGPMLVCHDGSAAADSILAPASSWAAALDVPIHLVHVTHPLDVESARDPSANVGEALEQLGSSTRLEWMRSSFPPGAIRELAREVDASVIAMSTHGRTGLARIVLGSVTAWVQREAFCPLLVRRPSGLLT